MPYVSLENEIFTDLDFADDVALLVELFVEMHGLAVSSYSPLLSTI